MRPLPRSGERGGRVVSELVAAVAVPHASHYLREVPREPQGHTAQVWRAVGAHLEAVRPDVLLMIGNDHMNTFFFDNLPLFCVGVADRTDGPHDEFGADPSYGMPQHLMPQYEVPVNADLAQHVRARGIADGFDLALTQEFSVDHSMMVPLHFLRPAMDLPIVPLWVNGVAPPLPTARRCHALGASVGRAIASWPPDARVAIVASGSISRDLGSPLGRGQRASVPDPAWAATVVRHLQRGEARRVVEEATADRLALAGNVAGELLNWIALLGAVGDRKPVLAERMGEGDASIVWRWDL